MQEMVLEMVDAIVQLNFRKYGIIILSAEAAGETANMHEFVS